MEQKQLRKEYKDNGYLVFKNVLDAGLLQETSNHVDWLMGKNPDLRPENLGHSLMTNDPFWVRLVLVLLEKFEFLLVESSSQVSCF